MPKLAKRLSAMLIATLTSVSLASISPAQAIPGCDPAGAVASSIADGDPGFGGGTGTAQDPWQICSVAQLRAIETNDATLDGNYVLKSDLNVTEAEISGATSDGSSVTYTTSSAHPYRVGDKVTITGITPSDFNLAAKTITAVGSSTTFTLSEAGISASYLSGGAVTAVHWQPIGTASVTTSSGNGTTVTLTTASSHSFQTGDVVTLVTSASFSPNKTPTITRISDTQISFANTKTSGFENTFFLYEKPFVGTFNGQGFEISGIKGSSNFAWYQWGLFHTIGSTGEVSDLSISGSMVSSALSSSSNDIAMGLLAYYATSAVLKRITVTSVSFQGSSPTTGYIELLGGLVGGADRSKFDQIKISNLLFQLPALAADLRVGGLAGRLTTESDIKRTSVDGEIRGMVTNAIVSVSYIAGLVADFQGSTASQIYASVDFTNPAAVVHQRPNLIFTGGIIGSLYNATVRDSRVEASVDSYPNYGGVGGQAEERRLSGLTNSVSRVIVRVTPSNLGASGNPAFSRVALDTTTGVSVSDSFYDKSLWTETLETSRDETQLADFSGNGATVLYTTTTAHGLEVGDIVHANGMVPSEYGLLAATVATVPSSTEFTVTSTVTGARNASYTGFVIPKDSRNFVGKTTAELQDSATYAAWTVANSWDSVASDGWFYAVVQAATTGTTRTVTTTGPHSFAGMTVSISGSSVANYNTAQPATLQSYTANTITYSATAASTFNRMADAHWSTLTLWKKVPGGIPSLIWMDLPNDTELKFHANYAGSTDPVTTKRVTSYPATVGASPFTRAGYTLVGWNTLPDGTGEQIAPTSGSVNRSVNLYAQWKIDDANLSTLYETFEESINPTSSAKPGETIWASAIERELSRELFTAAIQGGQTSAVEEYAYRITKSENQMASSLDAQGTTGYSPLTAQQQDTWYTSLGYTQQSPYEFSWSAFLCVDNTTSDVSLPSGLKYSYATREKGVLPNDAFNSPVSVFYNEVVDDLTNNTSPSTRTVVGDDTVNHKYLGTLRGNLTALGISEVTGTCAAGTTLQGVRLVDPTSTDGAPVYITTKSFEVPAELTVYIGSLVKAISSTGATIGVTGVQAQFNAALWGLTTIGTATSSTPAAPSVPYLGPLNLKMQNQAICSGGEVVLTGQRLDTISGVEVGTKPVAYQLLTNGNFKYSLKDVLAGRYQVKLWVPVNSLYLTSDIVVARCDASSALGRVNVGSFNGKLVVYAAGLEGKRISWKVGGRWGRAVANNNFARFDRPTPRRGVEVNVEIFVDGVSQLTKRVVTR